MTLLNDHGTKLIGGLTTAIGVLSSIDPAVLTSLLGTRGLSYVTVLAGILTTLRGFQNNKTQGPAPPPPT